MQTHNSVLLDESRKLVGKEEERLKLSFSHLTLEKSVHPKGRVISLDAQELEGNTDQSRKVDSESLHAAWALVSLDDILWKEKQVRMTPKKNRKIQVWNEG